MFYPRRGHAGVCRAEAGFPLMSIVIIISLSFLRSKRRVNHSPEQDHLAAGLRLRGSKVERARLARRPVPQSGQELMAASSRVAAWNW